ncbi:uncharacterized protein LOC126669238 [Mercurialis annua]|uniref:uncharacterized protein LOC126669238 n=1 Tax=Mercurialis annua TaxID=3986 RepID=UPI00215FD1A3|nr:uncharacterized protein LOC126669238 [Mercurialis annua]
MVSQEAVQAASRSTDQPSSPRISFSTEFLDENNFISITPNHHQPPEKDQESSRIIPSDFEFLSNTNKISSHAAMLTADELFFEGKLLPFWQTEQSEKLHKINLKSKHELDDEDEQQVIISSKLEESRVCNNSWFVDEDPSPRPPKCTVLWKELLKLKKQRANSSLSPSSSSSSTSSSSSSLADAANSAEEKKNGGSGNKEKTGGNGKRIKKGLERTRSATIRIRPMINVPICTQLKNSSLPPLFPLKKGRLER